ncbi:hypothetical protein [Oceanobacillus kimchii]|uniref:hypothetical protein n=1 Tax=Oceanobacillus kimchii TaxID=746691 RepID=UPI00034931A1|nr:hypothetical protein [Oceanobacillus kimchii]
MGVAIATSIFFSVYLIGDSVAIFIPLLIRLLTPYFNLHESLINAIIKIFMS